MYVWWLGGYKCVYIEGYMGNYGYGCVLGVSNPVLACGISRLRLYGGVRVRCGEFYEFV
jgi:hypothetical protein